jgi:hypothetical protein
MKVVWAAIPEPFIPSLFLKSATFNLLYTHYQIVKTRLQDSRQLSKYNHKLRTRIPVILLLAAAMCILIIPATAHAPSNITIAYNPDMHRLSVTVTHPVDDPKTHYIRGVQVKINGEVISDPSYKSQPGRNSFTYTYDVMLNPEDSVWVVATCVNGQSLESHYDIPKAVHMAAPAQTLQPATATSPPATATHPPATGTTYADAGLLPLFGAAAVLMIMRK